MQRLLLFLIAASCLHAQFTEFAVTDDGRLYFATSLRTGNEDDRYKVYRITGDGLSLFATGGDPSIARTAGQPLTSGDGSITGYALYYPCRTGSCGLSGLPRTTFELQGASAASHRYDTLQISRNGRFLLGRTFDARAHLIDLASNTTREFPQVRVPASRQSVANSGALLLLGVPEGTPPIQYVPFGEDPRPIPGTEGAASAFLSPNADRVAYERSTETHHQLILTDIQGSAHRVLASVPIDAPAPWPAGRFRYEASFANDGTLLYLQPDVEGVARPMLLSPGGEPRHLAQIEGGAYSAILSGNGELAWFGTYSGKLLRVRTADGVADEAIPETPYIRNNSFSAYPGSVIRLSGSGFSTRTQFIAGETTLGIAEIRGQDVAVQVPWEFTPGMAQTKLIVRGPASPFRQEFAFGTLDQPSITFERAGFEDTLQAAHNDFRGVISPTDPARPGETIHVFVRNLGPVDQPVRTGQPSPSDPPARATAPLACYLLEFNAVNPPPRIEGLVIPFAGLAGGSIGIYQIDVTIPADWHSPLATLQCRTGVRGDNARLYIAVDRPATSQTP